MNSFIEIELRENPEFSMHVQMDTLYSRFHLALVRTGYGKIGVSFPAFGGSLGECLRLHGSESDLVRLTESNWLNGFRDYAKISKILKVPTSCKFRCVSRIQPRESLARQRRRVRRAGIKAPNPEIIVKPVPLRLPFVNLTSHSSGQHFPLFILHGDLLDQPQVGVFSSYGLSNAASVPWF